MSDTIREFYCVSKACCAVQIDDRIIYVMDGQQSLKGPKLALLTLLRDSEEIESFEGERRYRTNKKIHEAFDAAR